MKKIFKIIDRFIDNIEGKARLKLVHSPFLYALIGSVGIVSIWRGIWHISDDWGISSWGSLIFGIILTVSTGLFVSFFIGENIIISGLNKEKRIDEMTEEEIHKERTALTVIEKDIKEMKKEINEILAEEKK